MFDKRILAVYDSEGNYAYRLMEYLSVREGLPFEVHAFTGKESFLAFAKDAQIECLLIAESLFEKWGEEVQAAHTIILNESGKLPDNQIHQINKYQACSAILKEIMEYYTGQQASDLKPIRTSAKHMKVIGLYTPVKRALQTTFSLSLGQLIARNHKTLYLNFEYFSGMDKILQRDFQTDITDLMYFYECAREKMLYKLESMVENVGGLYFIPPVDAYPELQKIPGEKWIELFEEIGAVSDYEYLLLDLTEGVDNLFSILRACDKVYTLTREDTLAIAKMEQYEAMLKQLEYEDISVKTKHWKLPIFKELPIRFDDMTYGELAGYIKNVVLEDLYE